MSHGEADKIQFIPRLNKKSIIEWVFFFFLFFYLILRAIYVPPLHDEVATFFYYIEIGDIWSDTSILDANNHLLNSYLSRFMYLVFGEHFFFLRLPNVLSFIIYYWSIVFILKGLDHKFNYLIALVALNTIPLIFEYFALTRGYGLGLAFFMMSITFLFRWIKMHQSYLLFISLISGWLSVFSNLIFINSFALTIFAVIVLIIIHRSSYTLKKYVIQIGSILLVGILTLPLIIFGLKLKSAGALYYGSLDGFWSVTGKSLSNLVLFTESQVVMWLVIVTLTIITAERIIRLFKVEWRDLLQKRSTIIVFFLLGNIIITYGLAAFFKVNYPEDRAGIYFVVLFFLSIIFAIDKINWKYGSFPFLFFPITFLFGINFSKTVITPGQILTPEFYNEIRSHLDKTGSLQVYTTQNLAWAYYERSKKDKVFALNQRDPSPAHDLVVTRMPFYNPNRDTMFKSVYKDSLTKDHILVHNEQLIRHKISEINTSHPWTDSEFMTFLTHEPDNEISFDKYLYKLKGKIEIDSIYNNISVVFSGNNEKGEQIIYTNFPLRWYFGARNLVFDFEINHPLALTENSVHSLKIYIWNPQKRSFKLSNSKLEIYGLR